MTKTGLIIFLIIVVAIFALALGFGKKLAQWQWANQMRKQIGQYGSGRAISKETGAFIDIPQLQKLIEHLSKLSADGGGDSDDKLRYRFLQAGIRRADAPKLYRALKSILAIILPLLVMTIMLIMGYSWLKVAGVTVTVAIVGYYLPEIVLKKKSQTRAEEMRLYLPPFLDLLVICAESGLELGQAIARVSQEIASSSQVVAYEFQWFALETRAGASRVNALRNLARRVNLPDLDNLVSMLIQADRFGTNIVDALWVQSDMMRTKKMQKAEEIAAKIPTKMLIPLVLCIFPVLLLVLIGPAAMQMKTLFGG